MKQCQAITVGKETERKTTPSSLVKVTHETNPTLLFLSEPVLPPRSHATVSYFIFTGFTGCYEAV